MVLHPATRILIFLIVAIALQWLHAIALTALALSLVALLALLRAIEFVVLIRRARFLLISLISIYALATPGESLLPPLGTFSPSVEGIQAGILQVSRLTLLLASLALLMATTPRQQLLAGLYALLLPFEAFGVDAERIAVRLWLTLQYAEVAARAAPWRQDFRRALEPGSDAASVVKLPAARFAWPDAAALAASFGVAALLLS